MSNIYKVYVDAGEDYEVWTQEANNPSSAIKKVLSKTPYGKSSSWEEFDISAELHAKNMTYVQYKATQDVK